VAIAILLLAMKRNDFLDPAIQSHIAGCKSDIVRSAEDDRPKALTKVLVFDETPDTCFLDTGNSACYKTNTNCCTRTGNEVLGHSRPPNGKKNPEIQARVPCCDMVDAIEGKYRVVGWQRPATYYCTRETLAG
jgi:hypothetical protein